MIALLDLDKQDREKLIRAVDHLVSIMSDVVTGSKIKPSSRRAGPDNYVYQRARNEVMKGDTTHVRFDVRKTLAADTTWLSLRIAYQIARWIDMAHTLASASRYGEFEYTLKDMAEGGVINMAYTWKLKEKR